LKNPKEYHQHDLIQKALDTDQIDLVFQPILDIGSGRINHFEALLRLVNEEGNHVTPSKFLDTAERSGLVRELDYRVLQLVVTHLAAIESSDVDLSISLNLSGVHFGNPELLNRIREFLREDVVNPERLIFEVTETAALQDLEQARLFILELKKLGCRFALDDFGTGYASFYYLRSLPVDYIKIDGAFVRELQKKEQDRLFIKAMVDVARGLRIKSVAEYVNNQETLEILKVYGVDYAQGYFIGKPAALPGFVSLPRKSTNKIRK
jgi:EAL domain-containing protein (putative c-di-GMP-specific phosphodiesterase class I)